MLTHFTNPLAPAHDMRHTLPVPKMTPKRQAILAKINASGATSASPMRQHGADFRAALWLYENDMLGMVTDGFFPIAAVAVDPETVADKLAELLGWVPSKTRLYNVVATRARPGCFTMVTNDDFQVGPATEGTNLDVDCNGGRVSVVIWKTGEVAPETGSITFEGGMSYKMIAWSLGVLYCAANAGRRESEYVKTLRVDLAHHKAECARFEREMANAQSADDHDSLLVLAGEQHHLAMYCDHLIEEATAVTTPEEESTMLRARLAQTTDPAARGTLARSIGHADAQAEYGAHIDAGLPVF